MRKVVPVVILVLALASGAPRWASAAGCTDRDAAVSLDARWDSVWPGHKKWADSTLLAMAEAVRAAAARLQAPVPDKSSVFLARFIERKDKLYQRVIFATVVEPKPGTRGSLQGIAVTQDARTGEVASICDYSSSSTHRLYKIGRIEGGRFVPAARAE